jgi:beta-phosphoglucomutase-like phosphatase (HAD superfamily)
MDILLDLDGTLVDPKSGIIGSFQYALDRLGARVPPAEDLLWVIGPPLRTSFPKLLGSSERTEEAVALYRENYLGGAMYDAVAYHGVIEALDALAASGCRLFVATAKPPLLRQADPGAFRPVAAVRCHTRPRAGRNPRPQVRPHRVHDRGAPHTPGVGAHDR